MREITAEAVLHALSRHIGRNNGARVDQLVAEITGALGHNAAGERELREAVVKLRLEGHHVCAHPASGYYLASTPDELDATCTFLYERAMTTLQQIAAMKCISLPDLRGQLKLPT